MQVVEVQEYWGAMRNRLTAQEVKRFLSLRTEFSSNHIDRLVLPSTGF